MNSSIMAKNVCCDITVTFDQNPWNKEVISNALHKLSHGEYASAQNSRTMRCRKQVSFFLDSFLQDKSVKKFPPEQMCVSKGLQ